MELVELGSGCRIDSSVHLGCVPGRTAKTEKTWIGDGARIRSGTVIYCGSTIGRNLETGHNVVIREDNRIGDNLRIWNNSIIDYGCQVGNNVKIHSNCYVAQYTTIEDDVFLGPGVVLANDKYVFTGSISGNMRGPRIRKGARIGINVSVLPRVEIGSEALVGAGSVVTHDVPDRSVAYGVPARVRGSIDELTTGTQRR